MCLWLRWHRFVYRWFFKSHLWLRKIYQILSCVHVHYLANFLALSLSLSFKHFDIFITIYTSELRNLPRSQKRVNCMYSALSVWSFCFIYVNSQKVNVELQIHYICMLKKVNADHTWRKLFSKCVDIISLAPSSLACKELLDETINAKCL